MSAMDLDFETFHQKAEDMFSFLDVNHDGTLSYEEIKKGLDYLKIPVATHEDLCKELDSSPDKVVTKEQFEKYIKSQYLKVRTLFDKLDVERDYKLTMQELSRGLREFDPGFKYTDATVRKVFDRIDKNKDGTISFDEWCEFLILMPKLNIHEVMNYWGIIVTIVDPNEFTLYGIKGTKPPIVSEGTGTFSEIKKGLISLASGLFAGIISRTTTAPLERLKLISQVRYQGAAQPPGIIKGLQEIVKQDGIKGLFRGNLVTILRSGPETSIKLAAFDKQTTALTQYRGAPLGSSDLFLAGATSGVIAATMTHPLSVLRTRLAAAPSGTYCGLVDVIKKMSKNEGKIRPFFKGLQPTLLSIIPLSGLNLMSYELLKNLLIGKNPTTEPNILVFMGIGGASAFLSSTLLYPSQILTARLMMQGVGSSGEKHKGMFGIARDVIQHEGAKGFFKGYGAAMSKIIIGNGISYGCFEFLKKNAGSKKK